MEIIQTISLDQLLTFFKAAGEFMLKYSEASTSAIIFVIGTWYLRRKDEKNRQMEMHFRLKENYRASWAKLISHPLNIEDILSKDYNTLDKVNDEQLRESLFEVLDIISDALFHHQQSGIKLKNSEWERYCRYVFSKKIFITAIEKKKKSFNKKTLNKTSFNKKSYNYIQKIIKENIENEDFEENEKENIAKVFYKKIESFLAKNIFSDLKEKR